MIIRIHAYFFLVLCLCKSKVWLLISLIAALSLCASLIMHCFNAQYLVANLLV